MAETEFTCVFDDDTIPQRRWFERAREVLTQHGPNTVVGATGRRAVFTEVPPDATTVPGRRRFRHTGFNAGFRGMDVWDMPEPMAVDFVIHSYCFRSSLMRYFWALPHYTWANGEDLSFGAALRIAVNATFIVPRQLRAEETLSDASSELGGDEHAASKRAGHEGIRSELLHHWVDLGWRPMGLPDDGYLDPVDHGMSRKAYPSDFAGR